MKQTSARVELSNLPMYHEASRHTLGHYSLPHCKEKERTIIKNRTLCHSHHAMLSFTLFIYPGDMAYSEPMGIILSFFPFMYCISINMRDRKQMVMGKKYSTSQIPVAKCQNSYVTRSVILSCFEECMSRLLYGDYTPDSITLWD